MHRLMLSFILALLLAANVSAQETGYAIALRRIEAVQIEDGRFLNLAVLNLQVLPSQIWQLRHLKTLLLDGNDLTELPPEIGQFSDLQLLSLMGNQLTELPPEIGQLTQLERLALYTNELTQLPPEIGHLKSLQYLDMTYNQLTALPPEIGQLTSLQVLRLTDNQLTTLPPEIGQLTQLRELHLSYTRLTTLPAEIGQLKNLCSLDISINRLQHLPVELSEILLPSEACPEPTLNVHGNPLITPPDEIIAQGLPAIQAYLRDQAAYHARQLLVSAAGGVGIIVMVIFGLRWRYRSTRKTKAKRSAA